MKRVHFFDTAIWFVAATAGLICGCSGGSAPRSEPQQNTAPLVAGPLALPAPGELVAESTQPRGVSAARLSCNGSEYVPDYGQLVEVEDTDLRFTPDYAGQQSGLDGAAYAIYRFNLQGIDGANALSIYWTTPPENYMDLWLGLSHWPTGSWKWYSGPSGGTLDLGKLVDLAYTEPSSKDLYVVVVLTGTAEAMLQQLSFNGSSTPVAQITADPTSGAPPLTVSFDASESSSPAGDIVKYEWDWDGTGNWVDTEGTPIASHEYDAGDYTAWVRVTDEIGATATALVGLSVTLPPPMWSMFGYDAQHTHRSPYVGAQTNHVKWTISSGGTYLWFKASLAIAADGTVYVVIGGDDKLYAINPDGSLKWWYQADRTFGNYSPAIGADGTVYVGNTGKLYAIEPDGSLKWSIQKAWMSPSAPIIGTDGIIYLGGSQEGRVYAVNPDGSLKWEYKIPDARITSSLVLGTDGTIYIGSNNHNLYAINPDGSPKWEYLTGGSLGSPAVAADGTIYIGCADNKLYAINPDGSLRWSYATGSGLQSSPAIGADGTVYVGSEDRKLYAVNPDGSLKWSYTTGSYILRPPAIGADGTVYVGSWDAKFYAINPDGSLKWSYTLSNLVDSSPAIAADGTVYIGSDDCTLYAFGE